MLKDNRRKGEKAFVAAEAKCRASSLDRAGHFFRGVRPSSSSSPIANLHGQSDTAPPAAV